MKYIKHLLCILIFVFSCGSAEAYRIIEPWIPIYKGTEIAYASTDTPRLEKITAIRIDLQDPDLSFYHTPSNGGDPYETTRQTGSAFMTSSGCDIGINAHYYLSYGDYSDLQGLGMSNGNVVSPPTNEWPNGGTLLITKANVAAIAKTYADTDTSPYWTAVESRQWFILKQGSIYSYGDISIHPRSAVGITQDGRYLIFMTIDGRQTGYSEGASIPETAQWLKDFGCYDGLNLDGGGSTHMLISDPSGPVTVNSPSENRAVGSHVGAYVAPLETPVVKKPPVTDGLIVHLSAESLMLNNNDPVDVWLDSATDDAAEGTVMSVSGYGKPAFKKNIINGKPAVKFTRPADPTTAPNSAKQVLKSGSWQWDSSQGVTVIIFGTGGINTGDAQRIAQVGKSLGGDYRCFACDAASSTIQSGVRFNNGYCLTTGSSPFAAGQWHTSVRKMAQGATYGNVFYSVDGLTQNMTTNQPSRVIAFENKNNDLTLGNGHWGDGSWTPLDWYDGYIAEVLVYNKQLTSQQIEQVTDYISEKYELEAPVTDGLIIHLKANSLQHNNNDPVTSWADSASGDSVNGTVSSVQGYGTPVYVANAVNGMPAVRFVRSENDVLASSTWSWDQTQGVTIFTVCTGGNTANVQRVMSVGKADGTNYKSFSADVNSNQSGARFNNGYSLASSPFSYGQWHLAVRQMAQGGRYDSVYYSVNGYAALSMTSNYPSRQIAFDAAGNDFVVGNGRWSGGFATSDYYDGDVAEILVYNKQLTSQQIDLVESYLNKKYNVVKPPVQDGLIIHLRADLLNLNDGDTVKEWADVAVSDSIDGTVFTDSKYGIPTFDADGYSGKPAVNFSRSLEQALISETFSWDQTQGVTIFTVCTGGNTTDVQRVMSVGNIDGENYKSFSADVNSSSSGVRFNNGYCLATSPFSYGNWHIGIRKMAQGATYNNVFYSVDNLTALSVSSNNPTYQIAFSASNNVFTLGNGRWSGGWATSDWYEGKVAEILVYNKQLTTQQMQDTLNFLQNRP